jgi:Fe-S cluster biosynthesis and repair protein YggX
MVQCAKLHKEAPALPAPPYPGGIGKRIYQNVSNEAWQLWLRQQTILINEYRLSPVNPEHRKFLEAEMEKFLFGDGSEMPEAYTPPSAA